MLKGLQRRSAQVLEGDMASLTSVLREAVDGHADRRAVRVDGAVMTYLELRDAAGRMAGLLKSLGVSGATATPDLRALVRERVAACKDPRHIWITDDLPKGPTGKIQRRDVHPPKDL